MLDQYSKWNDSDITFRIFIADVSEDINLSGHDSYFFLKGTVTLIISIRKSSINHEF